ncbi:MAG: ABC transporter ATP-binding protein [Candidatus Heimdallarchaeota archaeon]|nr:ABC transporter ATP-binding protein [Candidatus Heimdallarchaeota archaeon]MCK4955117.1 ABC transporter ATP-binding protein [Candidatus Heimdallarchaeota archaeon]
MGEIESSKEESKKYSTKDIIVCLKDISVVYGNMAALYDINLDVHTGDFIGICGPNGSGKTTLMKTIIGTLKPYTGQIALFGEDIKDNISKDIRHKFGYVPQTTEFDRNFPALVRDVAEMGRYAKVGVVKQLTKEDKQKAMEALRLVDMEYAAERPFGHLSGGQQQRVLIAQALAAEAEVLLLDEFTSALDFRMSEEVMELLDYLSYSHKITVVTVGHNLELLRAYCNRIICINKIIAFDGEPNDPDLDEAINKIFH